MDYRQRLQRARSPERIATLIRAYACVTCTNARAHVTEAQRFQELAQAEHRADTIERGGFSLRENRELLREWGYLFGNRAKTKAPDKTPTPTKTPMIVLCVLAPNQGYDSGSLEGLTPHGWMSALDPFGTMLPFQAFSGKDSNGFPRAWYPKGSSESLRREALQHTTARFRCANGSCNVTVLDVGP